MQESGGSSDETEEHAGFNPNAPHPYQLALGVLCVQKVLHVFNVVCSEDSHRCNVTAVAVSYISVDYWISLVFETSAAENGTIVLISWNIRSHCDCAY